MRSEGLIQKSGGEGGISPKKGIVIVKALENNPLATPWPSPPSQGAQGVLIFRLRTLPPLCKGRWPVAKHAEGSEGRSEGL